MPPVSSLIFVVILAVWAVYLVQHWVRRRDHLATARSVDRFSEAMRVLERRRALPRPDVREHPPRSSTVQLLRPARPEVVVKRGALSAATAVAPSRAHRRRRLLAKVRAGGLLTASVAMMVLIGLSVFEVLPWWWSFVGVGVLAVTVTGLRWSASRGARGRGKATRRAPLRETVRLPAAPSTAVPRPAARPRRAAGRRVAASAAVTASVSDQPHGPSLYDVDQVEAAVASEPAAAENEPGDRIEEVPGGWSPVPVPPPTYTLKPKAYRTPEPSSQPATLPLDGTEMALDEEFEELPGIHRAG